MWLTSVYRLLFITFSIVYIAQYYVLVVVRISLDINVRFKRYKKDNFDDLVKWKYFIF